MINYDAIQIAAMDAVLHPDLDANLRHIKRQYSKWFHTPLDQVDELPLEFVLNHYFEELYTNMDVEQRNRHIQRLIVPPSKRIDIDEEERVKEDMFVKQLENMTLDELGKKSKGIPPDIDKLSIDFNEL
jgi:hypothetical protein